MIATAFMIVLVIIVILKKWHAQIASMMTCGGRDDEAAPSMRCGLRLVCGVRMRVRTCFSQLVRLLVVV